MWCDWCDDISYSVQSTVRLTKDGREILIRYCGKCLHKSEVEYRSGNTVSIRNQGKKS